MFYENVKTAAERAKDQHGNVHRRPIDVVQEDSHAAGFHFATRWQQYSKCIFISTPHKQGNCFVSSFILFLSSLWLQGCSK